MQTKRKPPKVMTAAVNKAGASNKTDASRAAAAQAVRDVRSAQASMVAEYLRGAAIPKQAIAKLKLPEMRSPSASGGWTIAQIVLHLMDSDLILADRMKRVIAEESPTLIGFNESAFAEHLFYQDLDPFAAADLFLRNRQMNVAILQRLGPEHFSRSGMHNERGRITLDELLAMAISHLDHHMAFLNHKKRLLGKPS